jgi:acetyl esterase
VIPFQTSIFPGPAAGELTDATMSPYFLELEPAAARRVLDELRDAPLAKLPIGEEWITVPDSGGDEHVRIVRPREATATLPVLVYMHGGGWVYTHGEGWVLGNRLSAAAHCRARGLNG